MIEAIRNIGKQILSENALKDKRSFLEALSLKIRYREDEHPLIFILNFDTNGNEISVDIKQVEDTDGSRYLWIGNTPDRTNKFMTTDKFSNILSNTLPNFISWANNNSIDQFNCLKSFYNSSKNGKYEFLDPELFIIPNSTAKSSSIELKKLGGELEQSEKKKDFLMKIEKTAKIVWGDDFKKRAKLFVVKINGNLICDSDKYVDLLYHEKIGELFEMNDRYGKRLSSEGNCYLCANQNVKVTSESARFKFKFFINDKAGFSSNFDNNFKKNYGVCEDCYKQIMLGENAILKYFSMKIGRTNTFILPEFLSIVPFEPQRFSECLKNVTNNIVDRLTEFEDELDYHITERFGHMRNGYLINYLFCNPDSRGRYNNILRLIKDIPPSRVERIVTVQDEIIHMLKRKHGTIRYHMIDLNRLFYLFPIKIDKKKKTAKSTKYLEILDSIFCERRINYSNLISDFIKTIRICYFATDGYNVSQNYDGPSLRELNMRNKIISMNYAFYFFEHLGVLNYKGDDKITNSSEKPNIKKEVMDFWMTSEVYNDEQRQAAFLLGTMIGAVGNAQHKEGHENKPILNKVNFQGMGKRNLLRLGNETFEKMRQYKILKYYERSFHEYSKRVNLKEKWELSNDESVFYVLSGYAFETNQAIAAAIAKKKNKGRPSSSKVERGPPEDQLRGE